MGNKTSDYYFIGFKDCNCTDILHTFKYLSLDNISDSQIWKVSFVTEQHAKVIQIFEVKKKKKVETHGNLIQANFSKYIRQ